MVDGAGVDVDRLRSVLRAAGARFAYLHGSQVDGPVCEGSHLDVAAWFGGRPMLPWTVEVPDVAQRVGGVR